MDADLLAVIQSVITVERLRAFRVIVQHGITLHAVTGTDDPIVLRDRDLLRAHHGLHDGRPSIVLAFAVGGAEQGGGVGELNLLVWLAEEHAQGLLLASVGGGAEQENDEEDAAHWGECSAVWIAEVVASGTPQGCRVKVQGKVPRLRTGVLRS